MTEKISTLILKVDLECCLCSKKIKKVLCKLQNRARIQSIVYDEKSGTVTVSGPFDPHCLSRKLRCMACKVIKDIQIKPEDPPATAVENEPENPPPEGPEPSESAATEETPPPAAEPVPPDPAEPPPASSSLSKVPELVYMPVLPVYCCNRPCHEAHHGCCRCCSCGRMYGNQPAPPLPPVYSSPYYQGFKIVCEDDPSYSCAVM